jgi:Holliday junction resolvasome RuvABC endonuclease subunit
MKIGTAYLGLDLGTHTGFARYDHFAKGGAFLSGQWNFSPKKHDAQSLRFTRFKDEVRSHLALGVDMVFYEAVRRHMGTDAAHIYGAFLAALHEVCEEYKTPFRGLEVGEIKKFATGKGNAKKEAMVSACAMWGFNPQSEDEADAIAILKFGMEKKL